MDERRPIFDENKFVGVNTTSMRVIPYKTDAIRQDNPYYRYSRYDCFKSKRMLKSLVTHGTVMEEGPKVSNEELDGKITLSLKDHQRRLVHEMRRLENCPYTYTNYANMGYLCDEVGTGKSLTMLSLIAGNKQPTCGEYHKVPFINPIGTPPARLLMFDYRDEEAKVKTIRSSLLVVPHTIYSQWMKYIETDTRLTCFQVKSKKTVDDFIDKVRGFVENSSTAPDIVLLKSTYYNLCMDKIGEISEEYKTNCIRKEYEAPDDSSNASLQQLTRIMREINSSGRQLRMLNSGYEMGTESAQHLAESIKDYIGRLEDKRVHLDAVMAMSEQSYGQLIQRLMVPCSGLLWNRVIFDEADTIAISNSRPVLARMTWMISASLTSFIHPSTIPLPHRRGYIRDLIESQSQNAFYMQYCMFTNTSDVLQRAFPLPEPVSQIVSCYTPPHARIAYASNMSNVIEAVNAGDTQRALNLCNCETADSQDGLIEAMKTHMQRDLTRLRRRKERLEGRIESITGEITSYQRLVDDMGEVEAITDPNVLEERNTYLQHIRIYDRNKQRIEDELSNVNESIVSLQRRITSMEERVDEAMSSDCPICMEEIEDGKRAVVKCCNASFCVDCLLQQIASYRHRTTQCPCPLCRAALTTESFTVVRKEDTNSLVDTEPLPTKEQAFLNIVQEQGHERVLLFSGYDSTFTNMKRSMDMREIKYEMLDGSDASIQKKISRWKQGKTQILCMNSRFLGAGLNLEDATDIIIFHKQTRELEAQVIGRAQRPGRDPSDILRIWKLSHDHEYDE